MGDWKLGALEAAFGMGKPGRIADVGAWITDGDEAAFARLAGRASKKARDWRSLGLIGQDPGEATMVERAFRLVRTVRFGEHLIAWIVGSGSEQWVLAYHRGWHADHGGPEVEPAARGFPHDRRMVALAALLSAIRADDALFAAAFRPLAEGSWPASAWGLVATLGAEHREDGGRGRRAVRRLGRVVLVQEKGKTTLHVLDDVAGADAFVASLPPVEAKVERDALLDAEGMVALWVDAQLDPKGTLDGKGGPVGWFDHDDWETVRGTPDEIRKMSYAASFADSAIARAGELGITWPAKVDALYGRRLTGAPGKKAYGWYLGAFAYRKG